MTQDKPGTARILIVYHSQTGNTERMAKAVAEGAAAIEAVAMENPDLVLNNLWLESMVKVWPKLKVFIVDGGESTVQLLPLEEFFKSAGAGAPETER